MSRVEVRERLALSPLRARSLFTVRAAVSSARPSDTPRSRWAPLMCSYWRARLVPFLTPAGGMTRQPPSLDDVLWLPGRRFAQKRSIDAEARADAERSAKRRVAQAVAQLGDRLED